MKKFLCVMAVFLPVFLTSACKSTPVAAPDADGEDASAVEEVDMLVIYKAYPGIIVDGAKDYTVKYGDTLVKIARAFYGDDNGYFFPLIMAASQLAASDPDMIIPGEKLTLPDLSVNLNDPDSRMQLKSLMLDIAHIYSGKADATGGPRKLRYQKDCDGLVGLSRSL
jgi:hypothetical protein